MAKLDSESVFSRWYICAKFEREAACDYHSDLAQKAKSTSSRYGFFGSPSTSITPHCLLNLAFLTCPYIVSPSFVVVGYAHLHVPSNSGPLPAHQLVQASAGRRNLSILGN